MHVLTDGRELTKLFARLSRNHRELYWAVAWATHKSEVFGFLKAHQKKIRRLIIGTHFFQTDPDVLSEFHAHKQTRFILKAKGIFHPKVFFFRSGEAWDCIVGSANLSQLAVTDNDECVVHFSHVDRNAVECRNRVFRAIESYWTKAKSLSKADVARYRAKWEKAQSALWRLSNGKGRSGSNTTLHSPVQSMTWPQYVVRIKAEQHGVLDERLRVLEGARVLFQKYGSLDEMSYKDRQRICGVIKATEDPDFKLFGSMFGAGRFKRVVKANSPALARALDAIPLDGEVTRDMYDEFVRKLRKAFPDGKGLQVGVASRLLAIKRPDIFVCLDNRNRKLLAKDFGIPQLVDFDQYWKRVVEQIKHSAWALEQPKAKGVECRIWAGRAAMLDSLYYDWAH